MTSEELKAVQEALATLPGIDGGRPGKWANPHVTLSVAGDDGLGAQWVDLAGKEVLGAASHVFVLSAANPDTLEFDAVKCGPDGIVPAHATKRRYRIMRRGAAGHACVLAYEQGRPVDGPFSMISFHAEERNPASA
jgi:hypothetical protein